MKYRHPKELWNSEQFFPRETINFFRNKYKVLYCYVILFLLSLRECFTNLLIDEHEDIIMQNNANDDKECVSP